MATIKYKGMELQSITECKVFEEPQEMLVWNTNYDGPIKKMVCAIIPYRNEGSVITRGGAFEYCAEIPKKTAPRRFTNRELAKWLSQGKGEWRYGDSDRVHANIGFGYDCNKQHEIVDEKVKIRKWDDTEWHEPTVDYLGIEDKEEGTDV